MNIGVVAGSTPVADRPPLSLSLSNRSAGSLAKVSDCAIAYPHAKHTASLQSQQS